jgi:dUTP pyrophosphatase
LYFFDILLNVGKSNKTNINTLLLIPVLNMTTPVLKIAVEDPDLKQYYKDRIEKHNKMVNDDPCPDSGFDLCVSDDTLIHKGWKSTKVDLEVKATMTEDEVSVGYYTYPRSSISKTPLVLANHVGIIDSGYRGNLIAMFRNLSNDDCQIEKQTRMVQICHASLKPFIVEMCESIADLGVTSRGSGGFGSTGK